MTLDRLLESGILAQNSPDSVVSTMFSFQEQLTAQKFAKEINSGKLSVEDAYRYFWSYEEDKELWGLPEGQECMALLPRYKNMLGYIINDLDSRKASELVDIIDRTYQDHENHFYHYNPFSEDHDFSVQLNINSRHYADSKREELRHNRPEEYESIISWLDDLVKYGVYRKKIADYLDDREDGPTQIRAALSLAHFRVFSPKILRLLKSPALYVRQGGIEALGNLGHYDPALLDMLHDPEWQIRSEALKTFNRLGLDVPDLGKFLDDPEGYVRDEAFKIFWKQDKPAVLRLLKHEDPCIRKKAIESLRKIKIFVPDMLDAVDDPDPRVKAELAKSMRILRRYDPRLDKLLDDPDPYVIGVALSVYAQQRIFNEKIVKLTHHDDYWASKYAYHALAEIGYVNDDLLRLVDDIDGFETRGYAIQAVGRGGRLDLVLHFLDDERLAGYVMPIMAEQKVFDDRLIRYLRSPHHESYYPARDALVSIGTREAVKKIIDSEIEGVKISIVEDTIRRMHENLKPKGYLPPEYTEAA